MNRIEQLVAQQEKTIWHIVRCTPMHVLSIGEAERLIATHLEFRAQLLEVPVLKPWQDPWRTWLAKRYPQIPGNMRNIAAAVTMRYPEEEHWKRFSAEMTDALIEVEGLVPPQENG